MDFLKQSFLAFVRCSLITGTTACNIPHFCACFDAKVHQIWISSKYQWLSFKFVYMIAEQKSGRFKKNSCGGGGRVINDQIIFKNMCDWLNILMFYVNITLLHWFEIVAN